MTEPITTAELDEAAERLRRQQAGEDVRDIYGTWNPPAKYPPEKPWTDMTALGAAGVLHSADVKRCAEGYLAAAREAGELRERARQPIFNAALILSRIKNLQWPLDSRDREDCATVLKQLAELERLLYPPEAALQAASGEGK